MAGQRPGVTGYARPGETATLGGSGWPSSLGTGSLAAELCGIGGAGPCQAAAHTLTTTLAGGLQGTATLPAGATTGARTLRVTAGAYSAVVSLVVLGPRTIALSPAGAAAGTPIAVTGANFDPLAAVEVRGSTSLLGSPGSDTADPPVAATATSTGALGATYTYADPLTVALVAYETAPDGDPAADRAASGLGAAGGGPTVGDPGTLGMRAFATAPNPDAETIAFTTEVPSAVTVLSAPLNRVRVVDRRGGAYGWTLSAAATDLEAPGGQTISKALLAATPTCAGVGAAPPGAVAGGPNQGLGGPVTLCAKDTQTSGGTTDGEWDVGGTLTLSLPSFQAAASYEGRILITLV